MMLIPPALNLGNTNNTSATPKDRYFTSPGIYASSNPAPSTPGSSELSPESGASRGLYQSPPVDGRMFGPKMQSDLPGFHMHAATAVVTGHPGSFPLNSPASYAAGAATAPSHSIVPAHYGSSAIDPASYYAPLGPGYDMKGGDMWSGGYNQPAAHTYYQYDAGFGPQYPYDRCYAMDMNDGVRRKNATRESTNTLKAWLQEHKKNPYPTKGEKIMLAIITKMTLTQVSTWFANARRRLKKENKMTWIPKNRANESGSGTEERRQSDDKDSDEKTDDEDCKSEKDDNDHGSDVKLETETEGNSSCQFGQQNPASLSFTQTPNDTETLPPTDVSENIDNKPEYGRMIGSDIPRGNANMIGTSNANATLSDKIHNANMVQNAAATGRYETGQEGYSNNRSIWSPIDTQKNLSMAVRPYHPTFGTDYHSQTSYHHDANGRRLSSSHSQGYPTNYEPAHLTPHMSLSHNTQESLPLHSGPHMGSKMFSPMSNEPPNKAINGPTEHELTHPDPTRRSEYPYTSPVTNLRNYVNGVFHAPPQQVPGAGMCDKNTVMQDKSPNPSGESVVSPSDPSAHYPHHRYDQNYLQHRPQGHSADSVMSGETYMLHRSMSVPYNSYYSDGTNCYPPQGMSDNTGSYYGHRANPVPSLVTAESGTADSTRPNSSSGPHHQSSPPSETMSNRRSSCMGYYENSMGGTLPRSSVPPPPYATQNQLFVDGPPHLTHRPSYDGLNPGSNQSASSHSPRALQTGMTSRDGGNFGCAVTSDDEEMRKMQSGESISDKASR